MARQQTAELLRQAAITAGLLAAGDPQPSGGATSAEASNAIEALLDQALQMAA